MIVAKWADHQPLHKHEKMFERRGIRHLAQNYGRVDGAMRGTPSIRVPVDVKKGEC